MRSLLLLWLASAALAAGPSLLAVRSDAAKLSGATAPVPRQLRVLTYNLHAGKGPDPWNALDVCAGTGPDGDRWLAPVADLIARENLDLVVLQEVLATTRCMPGRSQTAYLAARTGYHAAHVVTATSQSNMVLSRWPLADVQRIPLVVSGADPRAALLARVLVPGQPGGIWVCGTHIDNRHEAARLAQLAILDPHLRALDRPLILAGDMNAVPGSRPIDAIQSLATAAGPLRDSFARAGAGPAATVPDGRKIDWIFATLAPTASRVLDDLGLSDHHALQATFDLP